jgi:hypothetical protein
MLAFYPENGGIFPLKMELVFHGDGGFFPENGGLFHQEHDVPFS